MSKNMDAVNKLRSEANRKKGKQQVKEAKSSKSTGKMLTRKQINQRGR